MLPMSKKSIPGIGTFGGTSGRHISVSYRGGGMMPRVWYLESTGQLTYEFLNTPAGPESICPIRACCIGQPHEQQNILNCRHLQGLYETPSH
jgi:hypothetical protein